MIHFAEKLNTKGSGTNIPIRKTISRTTVLRLGKAKQKDTLKRKPLLRKANILKQPRFAKEYQD